MQDLGHLRIKRYTRFTPLNWYMTNLGTVITDSYAVGKLLYPKQFSDVDLTQQAESVYEFLLGRPVFTEMVRLNGLLGQILPVLEENGTFKQ